MCRTTGYCASVALEGEEAEAKKVQKDLVKTLKDLDTSINGGSIVKIINGAPDKAKVTTQPRSSIKSAGRIGEGS